MISTPGWEKKLLITFLITLFLFFMTQTSAVAFGPKIVDVTTKAFSIVWTTAPNTSCGINLYTINGILITDSSIIFQDDQDGKPFGINKVTVAGLDVGKTYKCKRTQIGIELSENFFTVTTERLRGLDLADPEETDIMSNDVVHKAVYIDETLDPAKGVLVLAEIYDGGTLLSDFPISAWVGEGMTGNDTYEAHNPNEISYKQYAALNLNNSFGKDHYPLDINEGDIIKFTIVHGTQPVLDAGTGDSFTTFGSIDSIDRVSSKKITTAKILTNSLFEEGLNNFALPSDLPSPPGGFGEVYETGDLFKYIEEEGGKVFAIWVFQDGNWKKTSKKFGQIRDSRPIPPGKGCFVDMDEEMTNELSFYGKPNSALLYLDRLGLNMVAVPQLPAYYETKDLWIDIEKKSGTNTISAIWSFESKNWKKTSKKFGQIRDSRPMINTQFYFVDFLDSATTIEGWDPFDTN